MVVLVVGVVLVGENMQGCSGSIQTATPLPSLPPSSRPPLPLIGTLFSSASPPPLRSLLLYYPLLYGSVTNNNEEWLHVTYCDIAL